MFNHDQSFYGVATIDIRLSGLTQLVNETTNSIAGYAFVVDRNNKFLSYPELTKAKFSSVDANGSAQQDFYDVKAFSQIYPVFTPIAQQLEQINESIIQSAQSSSNELDDLANLLAFESYQISRNESTLLAAIMRNDKLLDEKSKNIYSLKVAGDVLLNETVMVNTFLLPETFWKIVLVTPEKAFSQKTDTAVLTLIYYLFSLLIVIFLTGYWLVGKDVIKPFRMLVAQLSSDEEMPLDESAKNEFGLVANKINQKTQALRESNQSMLLAINKRDESDKLKVVSEKRFSAIASSAPDAIVSVNSGGVIIDWNPAAAKIFGYPASQIIGKKYSRLLVPSKTNQVLKDIERYLNSEIDQIEHSLIQLQAIKNDGFIFTAELSTTSWYDETDRYFSIFLRDVSERIKSEYQLRHQALHDPLSGLPNRNLFKDRLNSALQQARRTDVLVAVMIIDLDNFKIINDTLGHGVGDKLLKVIAERVANTKRATDTIARLGGDEFGVIQTNFSQPSDAMLFATKLHQAISLPVTIEDNTFRVGCSIGVTVYPNDASDSEYLLRNADIAMYRAKEDGRNSIRFFVDEMNKEIQQRKEILEDISVALSDDQFEIYLQPLINLVNNQTVGAEALIRWRHPTKGFIPPDQFIPIAEQSHAINDIGNWVIKEVCRLLNAMDALHLPPLTIAINISPAQFKRENIFESLSRALTENNVAADRVECEITESAIMDNVERVIQVMHSLRGAGFRLAIDDFGTGYSSLNYLKRFPINKIKIDRSFIADIISDEDSAAIAKSIIQLGHSMNLEVLAEGVETEQQQAWLVAQQCDMSQGYFRAKPMPFNSFVEWLTNNC